MSSEIKPQKAINFLALVRKDLEGIRAPKDSERFDESGSTIVTGRYPQEDVDTHVAVSPADSPAIIGRFEIIETLGEGGFARVFLANDPNLDREVAVKVPKPHVLMSAESVARFQREAKSAAILSHPNIVPVFESGSTGPIHFIASEFCPGPTLRQWFVEREKNVQPKMAVEIVACLADALQHAHHRGIIHRDLKPANIILVEGDESVTSRLRITDFGLARQIADEDSLTANGAIVGTPAYMSPEQASGSDEVDHRSDIYSLGMILYELLTGNSPFKRKSHIASIAAVINEKLPSIRNANSKVDFDLEAICLKALTKDPQQRYESAHDFVRDLERWLAGKAVSARKLSRAESFKRWLTRNPLLAASLLFAVSSLAAGLLVSTSQWQQSQSNLALALQQKERAEKNADELHATIIKAIDLSLESVEKDYTFSSVQQDVLDELVGAHKRLIDEEAEFEVTDDTFECYERLSKVYRETGRYAESSSVCEQAEKMMQHCFETEAGKRKFYLSAAKLKRQQAAIASETQQPEATFKAYIEAIELHQLAEDHSDRLQWLETGFLIHRNFGFHHHSERKLGLCAEAFDLAASYANEAHALAPNDEQMTYYAALCFCDKSHVNRYGEGWQESLEMLEEAERRFMEIASNPESELDCRYRLCYIRHEIGLYLRANVKDYERSEEYAMMAVEGLKELIQEFPGQLSYTNRLSHAYLRLIDLYEEQSMFDEMLALMPVARKAHEAGYPRWAEQRIGLNLIDQAQIQFAEFGEPELALRKLDEAIALMESSSFFAVDTDQLVNTILKAHREKRLIYNSLGMRSERTRSAGDGYRLALQRAIYSQETRHLDKALSTGLYYARLLASSGKFGQAKAVLDSLAETGSESSNAQFDISVMWARMDHMQRERGLEKDVWEASRAKSLEHLSNAINLGFDDIKKLESRKYFREYRHLPDFESSRQRIKP